MSESYSRDFYLRREATERRLAARALDPVITAIHEKLADEYAKKVEQQELPTARISI
jgi:hypothetical protein